MNRRCGALPSRISWWRCPAAARQAQSYPNRAIRIMVPFAAGGAVDTLARLIGTKLSERSASR